MSTEVITADPPLQRVETTETAWVGGTNIQVKVVRFSLDQQWLDRRIQEKLLERMVPLEAKIGERLALAETYMKERAGEYLQEMLVRLAPTELEQFKALVQAGDALNTLEPVR